MFSPTSVLFWIFSARTDAASFLFWPRLPLQSPGAEQLYTALLATPVDFSFILQEETSSFLKKGRGAHDTSFLFGAQLTSSLPGRTRALELRLSQLGDEVFLLLSSAWITLPSSLTKRPFYEEMRLFRLFPPPPRAVLASWSPCESLSSRQDLFFPPPKQGFSLFMRSACVAPSDPFLRKRDFIIFLRQGGRALAFIPMSSDIAT